MKKYEPVAAGVCDVAVEALELLGRGAELYNVLV